MCLASRLYAQSPRERKEKREKREQQLVVVLHQSLVVDDFHELHHPAIFVSQNVAVQNEDAGARGCSNPVEDSAAGAAAVHGHDPPTSGRAFREDVVKNGGLRVPVLAKFRGAVEPNLADIADP